MARKKIGLALGSGGPRGFALIGVIQTLVKYEIPIDYIAGSSAGAIIGGVYAVNRQLSDLEHLAAEFPLRDMISALLDVNFREGVVKGNRFLEILRTIVGETRIEDTVIPFAAVATEKKNGETVTLRHGSLAEAMRASSSIPVMFAPYRHEDHELLDGGVNQQVPVEIVREMGADLVIAVNLSEKVTDETAQGSLPYYFLLVLKALARENVKTADIVIAPKTKGSNWVRNFSQREELITEGVRAAEALMPQIKSLLK